ncbi:MAG: substrate-binding domain-containing protein [Verrucomicrobiota bacterium]
MTSLRLPSRLTVAALALLAGLTASCSKQEPAAGSSAAPAGKKIVIGLSLDTLKEERWQHDRDIFVAEAGKLGAEVVVLSANSDDTAQVRDVQSLISRGVSVLVVVPHNGDALDRAVTDANAAKIPVIAYDRLIMKANIDYYLTFDNVNVGEEQAKYAAAHLPAGRKAKVVRIYGAPTDNNAKLFKEGQDKIVNQLVKDGKIEVVHEDWATDWKPDVAKRIMNAAITKAGRDIDIVIASNDGTAGGAIQALIEEGLAGKVLVTGQDAELAACQRIMAGTQAMTIYKPLKKLAELAAKVAVDVAKGSKPSAGSLLNNGLKDVPSIFEKVIAVNKDNMMATVVADGFQKAEDLKK